MSEDCPPPAGSGRAVESVSSKGFVSPGRERSSEPAAGRLPDAPSRIGKPGRIGKKLEILRKFIRLNAAPIHALPPGKEEGGEILPGR